ncbi:MAG: hypothetical protein V1806_07550 [Pseudomonadota bacterium]
MPERVVLEVPAPWGLALVLGLTNRWSHHQAAPEGLALPVPLVIVQVHAANDFAGALNHVDRLARRAGLEPLARAVPWQYTQAGEVGSADLVACEFGWRERLGLAAGWLWRIANPRPAWQAEAA